MNNENLHLILKLTERSMFKSSVLTDDQKLLRYSYLTARQPRRTPNTLYISLNKRRRLANESQPYGTRTRFASTTSLMLSATLILNLI